MLCPYVNFIKPTIQFCEANLCSLIAQPANAISSLIYIFIGAYLYFQNRKNKNNLLKFLGPIVILIGIFSFFYHASFTFLGQFLDLGAMFILANYLFIFNLSRFHYKFWSLKRLLALFVVLDIICLIGLYFFRTINNFNSGIIIFVVQLLKIIVLEIILFQKNKYATKNLIYAILILLTALAFWLLDYLKIWCAPQYFHYLNGHALWHIINSSSFIFLYRFYKQF